MAHFLGGFSARPSGWQRTLAPVRAAVAARRWLAAVAHTPAADRQTLKSLDSRKTYLVDRYTYLLKQSPVLLFVQHNNLLKDDHRTLRAEMAKLGAKFTVLRTAVFRSTLRSIGEADPASADAYYRNRREKHALDPVLVGPLAAISLDRVDLTPLPALLRLLERSNGKLMLMAGQVEARVLDPAGVDSVKHLTTVDAARAELAGLLNAAGGGALANILSTPGRRLYFTMESRRMQLEGSD
ncbi:mitochondrial 54S ribosomal protein uL10m [Dipodascopsis tothii]|uniref:mitochondrial 54S ribosomal protein uL10m n=1 Tax=Dipodascopsis tothii TaxID=44089 RepID=UPI0034CD20FC